MSDFGSKIPLHIQNPALLKAQGAQVNPSYESFRPNQIHDVDYRYQEQPDRPGTHAMSIIRRYPDGKLDFKWAVNMVLDAVHNLQYPENLLPIHRALLTIVFPQKIRAMEPMQAAIMTQFSDTEKDVVQQMVEAQLREEENYNAGRGGGSVEGRKVTRIG